MSQSEKGSPSAVIDPELLEILNGPAAQEPDWSAISIDYMLSLTPEERVERNTQASKVVAVLESIAARFNLRPIGWKMIGSQPAEVPDLNRIADAAE